MCFYYYVTYFSTLYTYLSIKFLKFLFQEKVVFDNDFALNELTFYTSQLIYYFLLDNKTLSQEKLENYLTKMLSDIGVKSSNLKINNFNKIYLTTQPYSQRLEDRVL